MPESIAEYNEVKMMPEYFRSSVPFKAHKGSWTAPYYPSVSKPTGSIYGSIGMARAHGACRFQPYKYNSKPYIRNSDIRLFNRIQGMVVDHTQQGQEMYNANKYGTPEYSNGIAL